MPQASARIQNTLSKLIVELSPEARHDRYMILLHTLDVWGPDQMRRRDAEFDAAFERMASFPDIAEIERRKSGTYRRMFVDPHFLYYRRVGDAIEVTRIIHQREAPKVKF